MKGASFEQTTAKVFKAVARFVEMQNSKKYIHFEKCEFHEIFLKSTEQVRGCPKGLALIASGGIYRALAFWSPRAVYTHIKIDTGGVSYHRCEEGSFVCM